MGTRCRDVIRRHSGQRRGGCQKKPAKREGVEQVELMAELEGKIAPADSKRLMRRGARPVGNSDPGELQRIFSMNMGASRIQQAIELMLHLEEVAAPFIIGETDRAKQLIPRILLDA